MENYAASKKKDKDERMARHSEDFQLRGADDGTNDGEEETQFLPEYQMHLDERFESTLCTPLEMQVYPME
jgi:hypothetical protein